MLQPFERLAPIRIVGPVLVALSRVQRIEGRHAVKAGIRAGRPGPAKRPRLGPTIRVCGPVDSFVGASALASWTVQLSSAPTDIFDQSALNWCCVVGAPSLASRGPASGSSR